MFFPRSEADRPIADRSDQHRDGGVAVTAQGTSGNHLHAVEQLEQRAAAGTLIVPSLVRPRNNRTMPPSAIS
jgi:hypothetical protein